MQRLASPKFRDKTPEPIASSRHLGRFLLIVAGIAIFGFLQTRPARATATATASGSHILLYLSLATVQVLFLRFVFIGIRARGHRLAILWGDVPVCVSAWMRDAVVGVGLTIALDAISLLIRVAAGPVKAQTAFLLPHGNSEAGLWVVLSVVAGVCEELIYRGYLQWQLAALLRNLPIAIVLQATIFACAHIYQGWHAALLTAGYGLAFGIVAAWRGSLVPVAIAHVVIDTVGGLRHGW